MPLVNSRLTVRWVLHKALEKGDKTTGKIHDPVAEYDIFKDERVEIFLEEQPSSNDEISVLNQTTTCFTQLALQEPVEQQAESSAAKKTPPSFSNSDTCIIMEIDPKMLGQGTFGACYKATIKKQLTDSYEVSDKQFAFKQMNMACTSSSERVWTDEANMLRKLNDHENIVKYLFSCTCTSTSQEAGQNYIQEVAGIAMEKCPGKTLHSFLRSKIRTNKAGQPKQLIPTEELLQIFKQSADGLHYMKTNQIIHCDIKLDNVMWDEDGKKLKFIDFGLAFLKNQGGTYTRCGTPGYMAPECYDRKVDFYSDVWSLGIMMSCLLLQMMPYESNNEMMRINEEKRRRKEREQLTEQEEEDYKQKKNKVIREEIENFKQGKQMTSIEERLREAHKEDQKFLESYQPESVINSNVFRLLASRIADCLTREGTGRPEPQQIIKDCETSLEEIRPTGSSGETPQTETDQAARATVQESGTSTLTLGESKGMPNLTLLNQSTKPYNESTGREESVGNAAKEDEEEDPGRAAPEDSGEDY